MSPAHVLEPTCRRLKRMLMEGAWPQGEKLEALRLGDDLGVSMTPVRDCLNRLVGERLVDMKPGEGYRVPRLSEQALRDLLDVNAALLYFALSVDAQRPSPVSTETNAQSYPDRVAAIFDAIALRSGNLILGEMVRALSERIHRARMLDPEIFGDTDAELDELEQLFINGSAKLTQKLRNYHARRRNEVAAIIRLMR